MKEVKTKRGKIGFGQEKIILDENYRDYFRNLYRELWKEGDHRHMAAVFIAVLVLSYGLTTTALAFLFIGPGDLIVFLSAAVLVYGAIWLMQRSRGFTTDRKINYDDIEKVELVRGNKWVTCPRFIVEYGNNSRRYVAMHSHLIPGVEDRIGEIKQGFQDKGFEVK